MFLASGRTLMSYWSLIRVKMVKNICRSRNKFKSFKMACFFITVLLFVSSDHTVLVNSATIQASSSDREEQNSSILKTNTLRANGARQNYCSGYENGGVPYFGVELNPVIKGTTGTPDIKKYLKVIQSKSSSILTNDMGYSDVNYKGPWNTTTNSKVGRACAEMNRNSKSQVCTVLQGAIIATDGTKPLDLDAAFLSARQSNGIYPNTVWGIRVGVGWEKGGGFVRDVKSGYKVVSELRNYNTKAHGLNLKIGAFVGICGEMLGGDGRKMLGDLASVSDFFVCGIYPKSDIQDPQDCVNYVTQKYEVYKPRYASTAPRLELILQTGWTGFMGNSSSGQIQFWNAMEKWAYEKGVRVYMHEAFDSTIPRGGVGNSGYWKVEQKTGMFLEKASGQVVKE